MFHTFIINLQRVVWIAMNHGRFIEIHSSRRLSESLQKIHLSVLVNWIYMMALETGHLDAVTVCTDNLDKKKLLKLSLNGNKMEETTCRAAEEGSSFMQLMYKEDRNNSSNNKRRRDDDMLGK